MHEYSLVASILERVTEVAQEHGNLPVEKVTLDIGVLQEIVPDLLVWAFDTAKEGTLAAQAILEWNTIPPKLICTKCQAEYVPTDNLFWECPLCQWSGAEVVEGDELHIRSITLSEVG